MYTQIISLLTLASVSLGAIVQMPLSDIHREQASFAQIVPSFFVGNEFRETCTSLRSNLTQEEIDACEYFAKQSSIPGDLGIYRLDFVTHMCGYKAESISIPNTISDDSSSWVLTSAVPQVGPGILYDRFAVEHFRSFGIRGK
jgi:hypothetical protein